MFFGYFLNCNKLYKHVFVITWFFVYYMLNSFYLILLLYALHKPHQSQFQIFGRLYAVIWPPLSSKLVKKSMKILLYEMKVKICKEKKTLQQNISWQVLWCTHSTVLYYAHHTVYPCILCIPILYLSILCSKF